MPETQTIFFFQDTWAPGVKGGAGRVLEAQARGLAGAGYGVHIIYGADTVVCEQFGGVTDDDGIVHHPYPIDRTASTKARMKAAESGQITAHASASALAAADLWIVHHGLAVHGLMKQAGAKPPMIYVFHSPWHREHLLNHPGTGSGLLGRGVTRLAAEARRRIEGRVVTAARQVVTLSEYMAGEMTTAHGVDRDKITIVPGGTEPVDASLLPDRDALRKDLGMDGAAAFHLISVRRMVPRMGLDLLVDAFGELAPDLPGLHLSLVGDGPEREALQAQAGSLDAADRVYFTGRIDDEELRRRLQASDLFVLPSRDLEGFGLVTVESLAVGTPVVATPVGGIPEILTGLEPDLLCREVSAAALAERIRHWHDDRPGLDALRAKGPDYIREHFSWNLHLERLIELIGTVS
jgi:glycosyltransferase involved in cell wall biosynthesis